VRVCVFGAAGRMGSEVCRAVSDEPGLELAAAVDPRAAGDDIGAVAGIDGLSLGVAGGTAELEGSRIDVAVDFTRAAAAMENLRWCSSQGVHSVVGTTGFSDQDKAELGRLFSAGPNCVVAPNFAVGAVLLERLAEIAAPYADSAEIVEFHHDAKLDAPSGTSLQLGSAIASGRARRGRAPFAPDGTKVEAVPGARGGSGPGGVRIHSVRLRGLVAHHEVVFGAQGQSLTLRHDSYDRTSFMPGVLLAVRAVPDRPGLTFGLGEIMGL
jgi:4-hydroxy-tetrahydrodipicolinate reductase